MKKTIAALITTLFFIATGQTAFAGEETPETLPGAVTIDASTLKIWIDVGEELCLLDTRSNVAFEDDGHIPEAMNCPVNKEQALTNAAIGDAVNYLSGCAALRGLAKAVKIVSYCEDSRCWASAKTVVALLKMGYKKIYWLRGGVKEWRQAGLYLRR